MGSGGQESAANGTVHVEPPDPGENVLLLASAMDSRVERAALDLLPAPGNMSLLAVSLARGVDAAIAPWHRYAPRVPARAAVVSTGDQARGAVSAASGAGSGTLSGVDVSVATVSSPGDLTGLGIKASQALEEFAEADDRIVVRFDSLTMLLQYADLQRAFRFLHVLVDRIERVGATGVFHMDPAAHDDRELATLRTLFDASYRLDDEGCWTES